MLGREGAGAKPPADAELALRGYCPVCLVENRKWVTGAPNLFVVYDGKTYLFPDTRRVRMFQAEPVRYLPALGGDSVVRFVQSGQRVPGDLALGVTHAGRAYFFDSAEEKAEFLRNPKAYAEADLALGGQCIVCRVDRDRRMPGAPQLTIVHNGMRYQFAGLEQQKRFLLDPARFTTADLNAAASAGLPSGDQPPRGPRPLSQGSGARLPDGSGSR